MIPDSFHQLWQQGIETNDYYLIEDEMNPDESSDWMTKEELEVYIKNTYGGDITKLAKIKPYSFLSLKVLTQKMLDAHYETVSV